jgi:TusA-related sulfurtransferase
MSEEKVQKKVRNFMKDVEFLKDHGNVKKGKVLSYHVSTAEALVAHDIVKILRNTKVITKVEDKVEKTEFDVQK